MFDQIIKKLKNPESLVSLFLGTAVVLVAGVLLINTVRNRPVSNIDDIPTQTGITGQTTDTFGKTGKSIKHKVKVGESLWDIAVIYYKSGYNWVNIAEANNLTDPNLLTTDQELIIPKADAIYPEGSINGNGASANTEKEYKVVAGDSLWNIACNAYTDCYRWTEIAQANNIASPDLIEVGQVLKLPR